jgi:hypothetical protein
MVCFSDFYFILKIPFILLRTKFLALHQLQECSAKTDKAGLLKFILFHTSED